MVEAKILVDELTMEYEGLYDASEFYALIDNWLKLKGYDKFENLNQEQVFPEGKDIRIIIDAMKWHTDYVRKYIKIELVMEKTKEVETVVDKQKLRINQGQIRVLLSGILQTDWEGRWEQKPIYYFIRVLFDKYIYRSHTKDFETEIVGDVNELREKIGSFLNLYRFKQKI